MKKKIEAKTGCLLKYYMDENNISYSELSEKTGISVSSLKRYATCKQVPEVNRALLIANILGSNVQQIWTIYGM